MTIYAITISWNGYDLLNKLYPTLKKASKETYKKNNIIWYLRDNGSDDKTEELVRSWDDEIVNYIKVDNNKDNYAKCHNSMIRHINEDNELKPNEDFYLFINNDITIEDSNSINYMIDIMNKDFSVGIVGAKLYYPKAKIIQHFGISMSPKHGNMPWRIFSGDKDYLHTTNNRLFQAVSGAFLLIRCNCFNELNNSRMNEAYNWAFDDIDMCLQVNKNQNKKIVCCAKTNITHFESATMQKYPINKMFMGNNVALFRKTWQKKYILDYFDYINDPYYNIYNR